MMVAAGTGYSPDVSFDVELRPKKNNVVSGNMHV